MKIYLGCSLTYASDEFKASIKRLKLLLRQKGHEVMDYHLDRFGKEKNQEVFENNPSQILDFDFAQVKDSDLVLAVCDYPSIGLGMEISYAMNLNKAIIAVAKEGTTVSAMVRGITSKGFRFEYYKKVEDIIELLKNL